MKLNVNHKNFNQYLNKMLVYYASWIMYKIKIQNVVDDVKNLTKA